MIGDWVEEDAWESAAIEVGEWNYVEGFVGPPKSGKSVELVRRAMELGKAAYVVAHDPNENLPLTLPGGERVPLFRHDSIASIERAMGRTPYGIHATHIGGEELIEFAIKIGRRERRIDAKTGLSRGIPCVVAFDEIVALSDAKRSRIGPTLEDLLARRRPHHVAVLFGAQYPGMAHYSLYSQSTRLVLFRMTDNHDLKRLAEGGVPSDVLEKVKLLKVHPAGWSEHLEYEK